MSRYFSKNTLDDNDVEGIRHALGLCPFKESLLKQNHFVNRKKGDQGQTLLHIYARSDNEPNDKKVCNLLLENGADTNCVDNTERTALHMAGAAGKTDITELLLSHGAYVNAQDNNKDTPLHIASTLNLQLCDLLLKCGADPNIKNGSHATPLFLAVNNALRHCKQIVKLLLKHGGNPVIRELNCNNSIEQASRFEDKDVLNWCKQNVQNSTGKRSIQTLQVKLRNRFHSQI